MIRPIFTDGSHMRLLDLQEVIQKTHCSRSWLLERIDAGKFPAPLCLGARKRAFLEAEVDEWISAHAAARPSVANAEPEAA